MNELEWLSCTKPLPMLHFLAGKVSERKLVLFSLACCRRIWHLMTDEVSRRAVETTENYLGGRAGREELDAARTIALRKSEEMLETYGSALRKLTDGLRRPDGSWEEPTICEKVSKAFREHAYHNLNFSAASAAAGCAALAADTVAYEVAAAASGYETAPGDDYRDFEALTAEEAALSMILREVVGNPFRSICLASKWLNQRVIAIADAVFENGAFERMPELADALESAGCTNEDILAHCRGPGPHVRGCWVVDLLLGQ